MHVPDGFLSAPVAAATWSLAAAGVAGALRTERRDPAPAPAAILGSLGAFVFAAQMINVPVAPGTSGHLVGGTLLALLIGPWRTVIVMAAVLAIQALLFQDGGLTAFGANLIDMGFAGGFVGWAVAVLVSRPLAGPRGVAVGAIFGAFAATLAGAALTASWLALSGVYPLAGILPVMLVSHAAIGVLEAALTGAVLVTLLRWRPDLVGGLSSGASIRRPGFAAAGIGALALLIVAFLSPLASRLPDGLEAAAGRLGFEHLARPIVPGPLEELPWLRGVLGPAAPLVAGLAGTLVVAFLAWLTTRGLAGRRNAAHQ